VTNHRSTVDRPIGFSFPLLVANAVPIGDIVCSKFHADLNPGLRLGWQRWT
jgi:hypothetical protein